MSEKGGKKKKKELYCEIRVSPVQYQRDFVFLSHNLGKVPRKYENLNSGLREQKPELPFHCTDTFSFTRCGHTNLCSNAHDWYQNFSPSPNKWHHLNTSYFKPRHRLSLQKAFLSALCSAATSSRGSNRQRGAELSVSSRCPTWWGRLQLSINTLF